MVSVKKGLAYFQVSNKYIVLKKCIQALQSVEQLCQNGFSKTRADYYNQDFSVIIDKLSRQLTTQQNIDKFDCDAFIKSLDIISARLSNDKEVKKEIIFLPYKASMWDSLESIWQAAADDKENCDAYVIPIPYCDRNPDGSAAQWHCEADQFPSYVPITDYREYDIAKHRPDVIYIHNPYDGYNRVTSVDSNYYSSELKKYTNMLVYVPYFVSGPAVSEGICQAPGIVVADHVIVESEEIKKQYEAYYPGGNPPKDKFLALGSPKFDKVLSSKKEDFVLPDNWGKIINGRKIILYNTSLGAMLENSDKVSAKLRYVFSVFKERKDVALWWRPHPLMKATMESMRPEILQEYEQIEQAYINEGWGIYDDTAELDRAITWSDAYYGDMSSVVWLYKVTGKRIMIQDFCKVLVNHLIMEMADIEFDNDRVWFVSRDINALFTIDLRKNIVRLEDILDSERIMYDLDYSKVIKVGNKIIVVPFFSKKGFIEYNLENGIKKKIPLRKLDYKNWQYRIAFSVVKRYKNNIYFIGEEYPAIVEYNIISGKYTYYTEYIGYLKQYFISKNLKIFTDAVLVEDRLFISFAQANIIVEFKLEGKEFFFHELGSKKNRYGNLVYDGENLWCSQIIPGGDIVKYDFETVKSYSNYPIDCNFTNYPVSYPGYTGFVSMVLWKNYILFFPDMANMVLELDIKTGKMMKNKWLSSFIEHEKCSFKWFLFAVNHNGRIYAFLTTEKVLLEIDLDKCFVKKHKICINGNQLTKCWQPLKKSVCNNIQEEKILNVDFKSFLIDMNREKINLDEGILSGTKIYNKINLIIGTCGI